MPNIRQHIHQEGRKQAPIDTVQCLVIIRQGEWQHFSRLEFIIDKDWLYHGFCHPEDRHFRRVYDRDKTSATDCPETRNSETGSLQLISRELSLFRLIRRLDKLGSQLPYGFLIDIS